MNKPENTPAGKSLPLPSPASPAHLDERILAQARHALPQAKPARQPWWLAGSATAAVLVVAVTLSTPPKEELTSPVVGAAISAEKTPAQPSMQHAPVREKRMLAKPTPSPAKAKLSFEAVAAPAARSSLAVQGMSDMVSEREQEQPRLPAPIQESLKELAELNSASKMETAQTQYQQLKLRCPECDLPETLEEAIAEHFSH